MADIPTPIRDAYLQLSDLEGWTRDALGALRTLLATGRLFGRGRAAPYHSADLPPFARFGHEYRVEARPAHRLLADYIAFGETQFWADEPGDRLNAFENLVTGRRAAVVSLSGRTYASAFRAARRLAEEPFPDAEDRFNLYELIQRIRRPIWSRPDLGVVAGMDRGTLHRLDAPVVLRDCARLSFALACGLGRTPVPAASWLAAEHRLLADLIAKDPAIPGLVRRARVQALDRHLAAMPPPEDIDVLREELRLEFAAVMSRLPEFVAYLKAIAQIQGLPTGRERRRAKPADDSRRRFAYDLVINHEVKLTVALKRFNEEAQRRGWEAISSVPGLRTMAIAYAEDSGHPPPPRRYGK